jgi:CheY-like chemotaxis protein
VEKVLLRWLQAAVNKKKSGIARALLFLAIFLLASAKRMVALDPAHRISQYGHTSWKIQDGYFGGQPVSVTQTADGYLWVATAVDDHPLFRDGITGLLADQPHMILVAEACNGREAIQQYRSHQPDITLMDLQMPEMNGLDAVIAIRGEFPEAKMIVLTTYTGDVNVLRSLKAGARAYLLKNLLHKELLDTIRAVHVGRKIFSPEASFEFAQHASDDQLTGAEVEVCG